MNDESNRDGPQTEDRTESDRNDPQYLQHTEDASPSLMPPKEGEPAGPEDPETVTKPKVGDQVMFRSKVVGHTNQAAYAEVPAVVTRTWEHEDDTGGVVDALIINAMVFKDGDGEIPLGVGGVPFADPPEGQFSWRWAPKD